MREFRIILKPVAIKDLNRLRKYEAAMITDRIERHLRIAPTHESRSRIRRLRGEPAADYRLRVDPYRIFFRVVGEEVHVLRVMHKGETAQFYREE